MSVPLKRGKINMARSENVLTVQFPLVKGKLILCEGKFFQVMRSEPGAVMAGAGGGGLSPIPRSPGAEGSCVGESHRGRQGPGLQVVREVGHSEVMGICHSGMWGARDAGSGCRPRTSHKPKLPAFCSDSQLPLFPEESPFWLWRPDPSVPMNVV